jgi:hypothetical protein
MDTKGKRVTRNKGKKEIGTLVIKNIGMALLKINLGCDWPIKYVAALAQEPLTKRDAPNTTAEEW